MNIFFNWLYSCHNFRLFPSVPDPVLPAVAPGPRLAGRPRPSLCPPSRRIQRGRPGGAEERVHGETHMLALGMSRDTNVL